MTTNDKQPTGWVVVDFDDGLATFRDSRTWQPWYGPVIPFASRSDADGYKENLPLRELCEVHPWPLPASVLARLKENHPRQDWSQVPVADAPAVAEPSEVERLRARVGWLDMLDTEEGRRTFADEKLRVEVEELRGALIECVKACGGGATERVSTEFLLGSPGEVRACVTNLRADVSQLHAEVETLRSEAERLQEEISRLTTENAAMHQAVEMAWRGGKPEGVTDHASGIYRLTRERDDARASVASVSKQLRREADEAIRERDEARAELAKARLSRRDEFAKAALTGMLADPERAGAIEDFAADAVEYAQATIRALDGAGGA